MANEKINERIELVRIDTKQEKDVKKGQNKQGKDWTMWPVSIKSGDVWMNGAFFKEEDINKFRELREDKSIYLKLWEEEYNGNHYTKFGFLTKTDQLEIRLKRLETFMQVAFEKLPELKELFNQKS